MRRDDLDVHMSFFSSDEVQKYSALEIKTPADLSSLRLGAPINGSRVCETCKEGNAKCRGHFGHIMLSHPVVNIERIDVVVRVLNSVCAFCCMLIVDHPDDAGATTSRDTRKHDGVCPYCDRTQPTWVKRGMPGASAGAGHVVVPVFSNLDAYDPISPMDVYNTLRFISPEHQQRLGVVNPSSMMWLAFIVLSHRLRPRRRSECDLTSRLKLILKKSHVAAGTSVDLGRAIDDDEDVKKYYELSAHIAAYQNPRVVVNTHSQKNKSTLRDRLVAPEGAKSKMGRMRESVMGKRADYTLRGVISPWGSGHIHDIGMPVSVCMQLSFPERVTPMNVAWLTELLRNGPNKYPGVTTIANSDGVEYDIEFMNRDMLELEHGWTVRRHLIDGDYVLMNRPPTLHRGSIMGHRVRVNHDPNKMVLELHPACTPPYNADYDGDQMHIMVLQTQEARAECRELMLVDHNIIKDGHTPCVKFVQHTLVALQLFLVETTIDRDFAYQLLCQAEYAETRLPDRNASSFSGCEVFGCLLPRGLHISAKGLTIVDGTVVPGSVFDKSNLNGEGGLIDAMYNLVGAFACGDFISDVFMVMNEYLNTKGLTVTWEHCRPFEFPAADREAIDRGIEWATHHSAGVDEESMLTVLDAVRDVAAQSVIARMSSQHRNGLLEMVRSGAKGTAANLVQISGIIGQQRDEQGGRPSIGATPQHSAAVDPLMARGFIRSSFASGLHPLENLHHLTASRIGVIDTCVKVGDTGYAQNKISKALEDVILCYDGSVRSGGGLLIMSELRGVFDDIVPGEAVGILAAQAISAPLTQMTLNSFHSSGAFRAFTGGVIRVKEIINSSTILPDKVSRRPKVNPKNPVTPFMRIGVRAGSALNERAFRSLRVSDVVMHIAQVRIDGGGHDLMLMFGFDDGDEVSVLRLRTGHPREIADAIATALDCVVGYTSDSVVVNTMITSAALAVTVYYPEVAASAAPSEGTELPCVIVSGNDIAAVLAAFPHDIDASRCYVNDFAITLRMLGIDAVRELIVRELRHTMNVAGVFMNDVHLMLLASYMTRDGFVNPCTLSGVTSTGSFVKAMTFESVVNVAVEAATLSRSDRVTDRMAPALIFGERLRVGTGIFDIISTHCDVPARGCPVRKRPPRLHPHTSKAKSIQKTRESINTRQTPLVFDDVFIPATP